MKAMTMRQRMLAVAQGRPHDRVPFVQYSGIAAADEEVWSVLGRGNMGILRWVGVHRLEHGDCRFETAEFDRGGRRGFRRVLHTPAGRLVQEKHYEPAFGTAATSKHFVTDPPDYQVLLAYLRDVAVVKDLTALGRVIGELGDDGLPHVSLGRTPFQQLWVEWVSIQDLSLHLADQPGLMEEVFDALARMLRAIMKVAVEAAGEAPIPYFVFPCNITAPMIGQRYFRRYAVPFYQEMADLLAGAGSDAGVYVHMDGDLKGLWGAIGESKVRGIDSLSPPPDNDTSAAAAAEMWPEMRLGVNFPSSVHLRRPEQIRAAAEGLLAEAGHTGRLQIQISENVPADRWRVSFPEIVRAIEAFGAPER